MMKAFGFTYQVFLATRPEEYLGSEEEWDRATAALQTALEMRGLDYEIDEGGGAYNFRMDPFLDKYRKESKYKKLLKYMRTLIRN